VLVAVDAVDIVTTAAAVESNSPTRYSTTYVL